MHGLPAQGKKYASSGTLVIGITGGMASGKSTLARMFAGRGIRHIDADKIVLMRTDRGTIDALAEAFPQAVEKNAINRAALAAIISQHPDTLATLERILHPRVRAAEAAAIERAQRHRVRALVLDIPLLFETDAHALCDVVIVAHAAQKIRRQRAFQRAGMTEEKWRRLLDRQLPDATRRAMADIVIPTSLSQAITRRAVMRLMHQWGLR